MPLKTPEEERRGEGKKKSGHLVSNRSIENRR